MYILYVLHGSNSTAYTVGDIVFPSTNNGFYYECVIAGTSGSTRPTWSTTEYVSSTDGRM